VDPIKLVCGNNVCKKHLDMPKETSSFKCGICHDEHLIPKRGFALNKRMQDGLEIQLNALKLVPAYDECKVEIQKANENVDKIESLRKNSEIYIYEYFEDIFMNISKTLRDRLIFDEKILKTRSMNILPKLLNQ